VKSGGRPENANRNNNRGRQNFKREQNVKAANTKGRYVE